MACTGSPLRSRLPCSAADCAASRDCSPDEMLETARLATPWARARWRGPGRARPPADPAARTPPVAGIRDATPGTRRPGRCASGGASGPGPGRRHDRTRPVTESAAPLKAPVTAAAAPATWSPPGIGPPGISPYASVPPPTGASRRSPRADTSSVASTASTASGPSPPAATNRWCRCSTADCGWSVTTAFLSSSVPDHLGQVAGHQQQRVTDGDLAPPDLDPQRVVGGQAPAAGCDRGPAAARRARGTPPRCRWSRHTARCCG